MAAIATSSSSIDRVIAIVPETRPITIAEAASKSGVSYHSARRALQDGVANLKLESYRRRSCNGSPVLYFRRYKEGSTRPLYSRKRGLDARTLASCWGGYTFKESTTWLPSTR